MKEYLSWGCTFYCYKLKASPINLLINFCLRDEIAGLERRHSHVWATRPRWNFLLFLRKLLFYFHTLSLYFPFNFFQINYFVKEMVKIHSSLSSIRVLWKRFVMYFANGTLSLVLLCLLLYLLSCETQCETKVSIFILVLNKFLKRAAVAIDNGSQRLASMLSENKIYRPKV